MVIDLTMSGLKADKCYLLKMAYGNSELVKMLNRGFLNRSPRHQNERASEEPICNSKTEILYHMRGLHGKRRYGLGGECFVRTRGVHDPKWFSRLFPKQDRDQFGDCRLQRGPDLSQRRMISYIV
jgi:hypothetical protein